MIVAFAAGLALSLPVKVDGEGYLRFVREGRVVYAASANLTVTKGLLGSGELPLTPTVRIPANAIKLEVDLSGNIVAVAGAQRTDCGRLVLSRFDTPPTADRGYFVSVNRATLGNPGEGLFGVIRTSAATSSTSPGKTAPVAGGKAVVTIQAVSEVSADQVTLGDVALINGDAKVQEALAGMVYGPTPAIGIDAPVTSYRIQALLKRAGITAEVQGPSAGVVRRKGQAIPAADFVAVATKAAQEKLGAEIPMISTDANVSEFKAPLGAYELKAESVSLSGTTASVTVAVYVEGRRLNSRSVALRVDASAQVKPGDLVRVVLKSAGVTVEVGGKVRTGGVVGQKVTVLTETGSVLTGVVIGADRIEVKL